MAKTEKEDETMIGGGDGKASGRWEGEEEDVRISIGVPHPADTCVLLVNREV